MEEKQVDLLFKVLKVLDKEGILKHIMGKKVRGQVSTFDISFSF
jgi:hypothetical protein